MWPAAALRLRRIRGVDGSGEALGDETDRRVVDDPMLPQLAELECFFDAASRNFASAIEAAFSNASRPTLGEPLILPSQAQVRDKEP